MEANEKKLVLAVFGSLLEKSYSDINTFLGSITIQEMSAMYHRLKWEDDCKQYGKPYDDMTEDDWMILCEQVAERDEAESYIDYEEGLEA